MQPMRGQTISRITSLADDMRKVNAGYVINLFFYCEQFGHLRLFRRDQILLVFVMSLDDSSKQDNYSNARLCVLAQ